MSLLLHTCWSIYFWLVGFKLVFESCLNLLFKKIENPSFFLFMFAAQPNP
jgi:hypothetical protein